MNNKELHSCPNKSKFTEWIRKHHKFVVFILIIFLLFLPLIINWLYKWETDSKFLQSPWATFGATYLAAIASFAMVFVTWRTLRQNKISLMN